MHSALVSFPDASLSALKTWPAHADAASAPRANAPRVASSDTSRPPVSIAHGVGVQSTLRKIAGLDHNGGTAEADNDIASTKKYETNRALTVGRADFWTCHHEWS